MDRRQTHPHGRGRYTVVVDGVPQSIGWEDEAQAWREGLRIADMRPGSMVTIRRPDAVIRIPMR